MLLIPRRIFAVVLLGGSALILGCSDGTVTPVNDAGGVVDTPATDTGPVDAGRTPLPPQPLYGSCLNDAECAEGLTCLTESATGLPGGVCNRTCTSADDCVLFQQGSPPVDGFCQAANAMGQRFCARICANGVDCEREGYSCQVQNAGRLNEVRTCIGVCTERSCEHGTVCDHESGRCIARGTTPPGRTLGQTCQRTLDPMSTAATRCRSDLCQAETLPDSQGRQVYTGYNGGQCIARCILPQGYNPSTLWDEPRLPRANCPEGGVCFVNGSLARGDLGICLDECTTDSDCRADQGYFCRKTVQLSMTNTRRFDNGWCTPVNCLNTMTPCPTGFRCESRAVTGGMTGVCIPTAMP